MQNEPKADPELAVIGPVGAYRRSCVNVRMLPARMAWRFLLVVSEGMPLRCVPRVVVLVLGVVVLARRGHHAEQRALRRRRPQRRRRLQHGKRAWRQPAKAHRARLRLRRRRAYTRPAVDGGTEAP